MAAPVAFVTGASRGLGKGIALSLAKAGYDVAVSARTLVDGTATLDDGVTPVAGGLDTTVQGIESHGQRGFAVAMDLLDRSSVLAAADSVVDHFGRIDVLVNNAIYQGPGTMVLLADIVDADLQKVFEGNVMAQVALVQHLLPTFVAQKGATVVNMISATARVDPPAKVGEGGWGMGYAMSKAAFERMAPLLMVEHGDEGVVAYSVDPGHVPTERQMARNTAKDYSSDTNPATPEVIGEAIAWLLQDDESRQTKAGKIVYAQYLAKKHNLVPGWPG